MVGTAISIGVPLVSSLIQGSASSDAASAQSNAANQASATQLKMFNQQRTDKAPYLGGGTAANNELAYLMGITPNDPNAQGIDPNAGPNETTAQKNAWAAGAETAAQKAAYTPMAGVNPALGASGSLASPFDMSKFTADPGYQFSLDQGTQALQRSEAAKGGLMSGAAMKALSTYAQGTAAQEYGSVYDRYRQNQNDLYSRLSGLSNSGQSMANTSGQAGTTAANEIGNNMITAGGAQAGGILGGANAWTTGLNQVGSTLNGSGGGMYGGGSGNYGNLGTINWY